MTNRDWIEFQIQIAEMADQEGIKSAEDLQNLAVEIHDNVERAIQDYAYDNDIEDYEPSY